jgi:hypothetical protein
MSARFREIACAAILALLPTLGARAEEEPPPAPQAPPGFSPEREGASAEDTTKGVRPEPPAGSGEEPVEVDAVEDEPAVSAEELRRLEEALAEDAQRRDNTGVASSLPDLSQVNLAQSLSLLQSMNPDISIILDVAGAWFSTDDPLQTGGHDPRKTGFNLQQLELAIGASVDPFFRFDSNIVFAQFGVEIEEAYATTLSLPASLQARAGQFLTRFGRQNPTHVHTWHFVDQPIVLGKMFGSEGNRGLGAELSWLMPLPWYAEVLASATSADGECCARSYFGGEDIGVRSPLDVVTTVALKQFFPFTSSLSLLGGLSAQTGPNPTGNLNRTEIYGTDLYLRYRPVDAATRWSLSLEVEAMFRARQVPFGVLHDGGGYAQLLWQIDPNWETGARYEFVSGLEGDPLDLEWTSSRHRAAAQLTYYPSHFSRLRLQSSVDFPTWQTQPIFAIIAAFEVVVGAHGSHAY